jgi:hypothetical protein
MSHNLSWVAFRQAFVLTAANIRLQELPAAN